VFEIAAEQLDAVLLAALVAMEKSRQEVSDHRIGCYET
jgi:hypothetical protein